MTTVSLCYRPIASSKNPFESSSHEEGNPFSSHEEGASSWEDALPSEDGVGPTTSSAEGPGDESAEEKGPFPNKRRSAAGADAADPPIGSTAGDHEGDLVRDRAGEEPLKPGESSPSGKRLRVDPNLSLPKNPARAVVPAIDNMNQEGVGIFHGTNKTVRNQVQQGFLERRRAERVGRWGGIPRAPGRSV